MWLGLALALPWRATQATGPVTRRSTISIFAPSAPSATAQAWSAARSSDPSSQAPLAGVHGTKVEIHATALPSGAQPASSADGKAIITGGRLASSPSWTEANERSMSVIVFADSMKARSKPAGSTGGCAAITASTFSSETLRRPEWIRLSSAASRAGTCSGAISPGTPPGAPNSRRASIAATTPRAAA